MGNDPVNLIDPLGLYTEPGDGESEINIAGGHYLNTESGEIGKQYTFGVGREVILFGISHTNIIATDTFTDSDEIIVEAFPANRIRTEEQKNYGFGNLEAADQSISGEENTPLENLEARNELPLAPGMTSQVMYDSLSDYNDSYPDKISYPGGSTGNFPELPNDKDGTANSNSIVGTIIRELGIDYQHPIAKSAPGWNNDVNALLDYYS